jgi:predicted nucleotidyltransferase
LADRDWEQTFRDWSKPPSDTEEQRCDNAVQMVRDAIKEDEILSKRSIDVFPQGSYAAGTNVKQDSDVDVCVMCSDTIFLDIPDGTNKATFGLSDASYEYARYRNEVEAALVEKFGRHGVTRGNKAFDIHENSYRVDADVVACFEHRRYTLQGGSYSFVSGTEFRPDRGGRIVNWPKQNVDNGTGKNKRTSNRFKFLVRTFKRLRSEMEEASLAEAKPIPSYLIECLLWNVPDEGFGHEYYYDDVRYIIAHLYNQTDSDEKCREWGEVNELKYLFRSIQKWTRLQANGFMLAAWQYVGFK